MAEDSSEAMLEQPQCQEWNIQGSEDEEGCGKFLHLRLSYLVMNRVSVKIRTEGHSDEACAEMRNVLLRL
jgi:hypothetical protein